MTGPFVDDFDRVIAALEARGQRVHRIGPGLAFALCPFCLDNGRESLLEIRRVPGGVELGGGHGEEWAA